MTNSITFPDNGDKQDSSFFNEYLVHLLEDRKHWGLTVQIESFMMIGYVQHFGESQGYFTRENVAELTHAAWFDEELLELQAQPKRLHGRIPRH
jgi:hypothetical protein